MKTETINKPDKVYLVEYSIGDGWEDNGLGTLCAFTKEESAKAYKDKFNSLLTR